jgi:uncharacterized protein (TIGR02246 family)
MIMRKVVFIALAVLLAIFSAPASAGPAENAVSVVLAKWGEAFNKMDADALAALYSEKTLLYGSTPPLYKGREGVKTYLNSLPRWKGPKAEFSDLNAVAIGSDVINVAGTAAFTVAENAPPAVFRLTQVLIREDGDWKIVSHHVSRVSPPPAATGAAAPAAK